MKKFKIKASQQEQWLDALLASGIRVWAPGVKNKVSAFREIRSAKEVEPMGVATRLSLKSLVFPKAEVLFRYARNGHDVALSSALDGVDPERVVWGCRPCDVAAFQSLDAIFNWDVRDEFFNRRRNSLTLVSFACSEADDKCFCSSVGGGPGHTEGSDVQITRMGDSLLVEVLTTKGEKLLVDNVAFTPVPEGEMPKEPHLAKVEKTFSAADVAERLRTAFNSPLWEEQSARCLGCGACAYVCPACACFDIQESAHGAHGQRIRCWDSCAFALFTLHTSGHNPRPTQASRWRQRIMHKFSYMPQRQHVVGCVGCGRCSRACPSDMNIKEHLSHIAHIKEL